MTAPLAVTGARRALRTLAAVAAASLLPPGIAGAGDAGARDEVERMLAGIPAELARSGPLGWLRYFEDDPRFLMAADGRLELDGYESARRFLEEFARGIRGVELRWSNVRIDPIGATLASVAAEYREQLTDRDGHRLEPHGYFTGLAVHTATGWKLRAAHWSSPRGPDLDRRSARGR